MTRRFSLMVKLVTLVMAITVVTTGIISYVATKHVTDLGAYALESNSALGDTAAKDSAVALNSLGERMIEQKSKDVARQVEIYLSTRPEMTVSDIRNDPALRNISVQPVGQTGYTAIVDATHFVILTHKHQTSVGKVLTRSTTYPSFWAVIERSAGGKSSWGYYDWLEPDNSTRKKYAYIAPISFTTADGESGLTLWATTYIDEFSSPVAQTREEIAVETRKTNLHIREGKSHLINQFLVVIVVMLVFVIVFSIGFARTITKPVIQLKKTTDEINKGNLDTPVDVQTSDEIGDLARSFDGMRLSLKSSYENLEQKVRDRTEEIRESERRLASIIDFLPDATLVIDAKGKVIAWNKAIVEMTGMKTEEMLGKGDYDYTVPFYGEKRPALIDMVMVPNEILESKYKDIRRLGDVLAGETFAPALKGGGRLVSATACALRDSKGQVVGAIEIVRDITQLKANEEALSETQRRFRAIIDQTYQFIGMLTIDGTLIEVNETALSFSGVDKSDVLGKPFWEGPWWSHSRESQAVLRDDIRRAAAGEFIRREVTHPAKDGSLHYVDFSMKPIRNGAGEVVLLVPEGRDITERKAADEAIRRSEERYRLLFDNAGDAIFIHDLQGRMLAANRVACEYYGYTSEEMMRLGPQQVDASEEAAKVPARIAVLRERGRIVFESVHQRKDRTRLQTEVNAQLIDFDGTPAVMAICRDITERKQMQEDLQQSERRLRLHVEQTPLAVIEWDSQFRVLRWNPGAERIFGHTAAEAVGRHASFIVPEPFRPLVDGVWAELLTEKGGERATNENVTRDGRTILCEWYNTPLVATDGKVVGVTSLAQDVTAHREAEERFRQIVSRALVGVFRTSLDGMALLANAAALRVFGAETVEEFNAGGGVSPLYADPEDRLRLIAALQEGPVSAMMMPFRRRDGTRIHVAVTAILVRDEEGRPKFIEGTLEDVTARMLAEQALRESEQKLLAIIDLLPDAVFIIDRDGRIAAWNKAIEELLGYKAEEMLGKGDHEYSIPFYGERRPILIDFVTMPTEELQTKYTSISREGDVLIGEAHVKPPRGTSNFMLGRARALRDTQGRYSGAVEIAHDLSERKRMEETLRQAKEVAESAARARSEFVANMSHEIRTPMNGVMGMLDLALTTDLGKEQREYLQLARSAADSLLVIIDDILDFSKIEAKKLDLEQIEFQLADLCDEILPMAGIEANRKGLELVCQMDPEAPEVLVGDPVRLKQVLVNLIKNAVKFTERGHVLLRTEKGGEPEPGVCELRFSVTDTGVGISADKLGMIFDSFKQADSSMTRRFGGTGLGLTISKSLVEMMGGAIWVESTEGVGSAFHFTVPFRTGRPTVPPRRRRLPELRGRRTLVIDDNDVNRRILRGYLESWEMAVDEAQDGREGLRRIHEGRGPGEEYDLVLLDCVMPGLSGFEVAEELLGRDNFAKPIIVMLSSMEEKDSRERCREIGIARFLVKPVSPSTLYDAIVGVVGISSTEAEGAAAPAPAAAESTALPIGARILVAEDNPVNVEVVRRLLKRVGLGCDVAGNGAEALEALARERYDVVLMDIQMPGMDGMEATHRIRQLEKATGEHVPIVALTAHSMKGDRARFLAGGMDDYLAKPLDAARLYQMIAQYTRGALPGGEDGRTAIGGGVPGGRTELLDVKDLLERMGGDDALVVEVLRMFLEESGKALEGIEGALHAGDAGKVRSAAHYFKSMSVNVSARALGEACHEVERLGAAGDLTGAEARLAALGELTRRTSAAIRDHLGKP